MKSYIFLLLTISLCIFATQAQAQQVIEGEIGSFVIQLLRQTAAFEEPQDKISGDHEMKMLNLTISNGHLRDAYYKDCGADRSTIRLWELTGQNNRVRRLNTEIAYLGKVLSDGELSNEEIDPQYVGLFTPAVLEQLHGSGLQLDSVLLSKAEAAGKEKLAFKQYFKQYIDKAIEVATQADPHFVQKFSGPSSADTFYVGGEYNGVVIRGFDAYSLDGYSYFELLVEGESQVLKNRWLPDSPGDIAGAAFIRQEGDIIQVSLLTTRNLVLHFMSEDMGGTFKAFDPSRIDPFANANSNIEDMSGYTDVDVMPLAQVIERLAHRIYQSAADMDQEKLHSPYSIADALLMLIAGASGETFTSAVEALGLDMDKEALNQSAAALRARLRQTAAASGVTLDIANRIYSSEDAFTPEYQTIISTSYSQEGPGVVNFQADPEAARKAINQWVSDNTHDKIKELIKRNQVNNETNNVLVNALYFKGKWAKPFDKKHTQFSKSGFTASDGSQVAVHMMNQESEFRYVRNDQFQAVELPYEGNKLSMMVILPHSDVGLEAVEQSLTAGALTEISDSMSLVRKNQHGEALKVFLPRFKVRERRVFNRAQIQAIGLEALVAQNANFSAMTNRTDIKPSMLIHEVVFETNEFGSEGAASSAVVMSRSASDVFVANRPFFFAVRDVQTGTLLFMGPVKDADDLTQETP